MPANAPPAHRPTPDHGRSGLVAGFSGLRSLLLLLLSGALLMLGGCQTLPQAPTTGSQIQQQHLYALRQWEAEGKIALRMGDQRQSANFHWQQQRDNYVIRLFGPFGQGATWLRRTSREVTLENAELGIRRARSAEQLMQDTLGWQVPVSNLQYWLRSLPAPRTDIQQEQRDEQGFLSHLEQQGWQVSYSRYQSVNGWWMPARIVAHRDDLHLTLVIHQWRLPQAPTP